MDYRQADHERQIMNYYTGDPDQYPDTPRIPAANRLFARLNYRDSEKGQHETQQRREAQPRPT